MTRAVLVSVCMSGCAHATRVRYEVPLDSGEARLCARLCAKRYPTERDSYARCLGTCPGAVERENAKCPERSDRTRVVCAEERREEVGLAAIIGSTVVIGALALLVLLQ